MGRSVKYTLEFCLNEIQGFLSILEGDEEWNYITWHDLVKSRPYPRQCISEWRTKFKDDEIFSDTIKKIEGELENRLFVMGLKNKANPTLVIFGLKNNYGWRDRTEVEHSGEMTLNDKEEARHKLAAAMAKITDPGTGPVSNT